MSPLSKNAAVVKIKKPSFWLLIGLCSLVFAIAGEAYWIFGRIAMPQQNYKLLFTPQLWHIAALFLTGIFLFTLFSLYWEKITAFLYRYRFLLAFFLFCLCVLFEISGSSIGMWGALLPPDTAGESNGVLFGMARGIRSDEWTVNTPAAMAQYNNHTGAFAYFNSTLRGTATDSFIIASQPVKDLAVIFRPFHWGYLFLSPAKALAFLWSGRFIALALVTFEFGMLIAKKNKWLSMILAILVVFSSAPQWWAIFEMTIYAELAILLIYYYFHTTAYWKRIVLAVALAICGVGFAIMLYPAWEIPMAYVCLALLAWVLISNRKTMQFSFKKDMPIIACCLLLFGGGVLYILLKSQDTIALISGSVYPGARFETGGHNFTRMFQYLGTLLFPFVTEGVPGNVCEQSAFFDFAPLGMLLAVFLLIKKKKKDVLTLCLLLCSLFFTAYVTVGFPPFLAKITLMSNCQASRVTIILGYVNILLLIRCLALLDFKINTWLKLGFSALLTGGVLYCNHKIFGDYLRPAFFVILGVFLFTCFVLLLSCRQKRAQQLLTLLLLLTIGGTGLLVNPIQKGADVIYNNTLYTEIKKLADESDGKWAVVDENSSMSTFPIIAGASTVTSVNTYPALDVWHIIDPDGTYEAIYNRYAHVLFDIQTEQATWFSLKGEDIFTVHIHPDDLAKLGVAYLLSSVPLEEKGSPYTSFTQVSQTGEYRIYQLNG